MADEQLSVRDKRQRDLQERLRKQNAVPRVRVLPSNDDVRKYIVHQPSQIAFPESGSVEWPDDAFTRRRIADGDVTVEGQSQGQPQQSGEASGLRSSRGSAGSTSG